MKINTDTLTKLCIDYHEISKYLGATILTSTLDESLKKPIDQELGRILGNYIYQGSSLSVVGGLSARGDMRSVSITDYPSFIGINPTLDSIAYPQSSLGKLGLIPSLVFDTYELENSEGVTYGVSTLFSCVALPLTEPHDLEVISPYIRN